MLRLYVVAERARRQRKPMRASTPRPVVFRNSYSTWIGIPQTGLGNDRTGGPTSRSLAISTWLLRANIRLPADSWTNVSLAKPDAAKVAVAIQAIAFSRWHRISVREFNDSR